MSDAITALEAELAAVFDQHAQARIITSFPGLGPVLGARVLGNTRTVSPTLTRCAVSPGPRRSPVRPGEAVWCPHDGSATGALATHATGGPSPR
jgi:hypothetical protein